MLPDIQAAATEADSDEDYVERDEEMEELLLLLLTSMKKKKGEWKALQEMMSKRSEVLILNALKGLNLTVEQAASIVNGPDNEKRKVLMAAIDNLVDFGVAEEYQMASEFHGYDEVDPDDIDELDEDGERDLQLLEEGIDELNTAIYEKYNKRWAVTENRDVIWAAMVASRFMQYSEQTILVYMTQGDERVRPWHRSLEGLAYPKESFPEWLIPPIEWACRCYLVDEDVATYGPGEVENLMLKFNVDTKMPEWMDPVFKESLAKGGRIFSDAHRYFQIDKKHKKRLRTVATKLKKNFINEYFKKS